MHMLFVDLFCFLGGEKMGRRGGKVKGREKEKRRKRKMRLFHLLPPPPHPKAVLLVDEARKPQLLKTTYL